MVPLSYYSFFSGCATVAGALIGLLFVAISVSPEKLAGEKANADHQVKAGAAFSALINTLAIALVALLPGADFGLAGMILAAGGLGSTVALILLQYLEHRQVPVLRHLRMLVLLFALYGLQLANAIQLNTSPRDVSRVSNQAIISIAFFLFAIERAWQLVGAHSTGLLSAAAELRRRPGTVRRPAQEDDQEDDQAGPGGSAQGRAGPG